MTYTDAWIENARPVDLEMVGIDPLGASALDRSPFFPEARRAFALIRRGVETGSLKGFQIDWGSYAAIMTRDDVDELLTETHGATNEGDDPSDRARAVHELREFVGSLPNGGWFKVVVEEY